MRRRASRDISIDPAAIASRTVIALSPTSTIFTRPSRSTCESATRPARPAPPAPPALLALPALLRIVLSLREKERKAFERHRQIDALQLDLGRRLQCPGREVQHRLNTGGDHEVDDVLRGRRRDGDHGDPDAIPLHDLLEI